MPAKKPAAKPQKPAKTKPMAHSPLPIAHLDQLAAWLTKAPVNEVEVEQKGVRLRLAKGPTGAAVASLGAAPAPATPPANAQAVDDKANSFTSPMVGTFYAAAGPEAKPFVNVGDTVKTGQTLCIIEAMKTMNQIPADRAGKILKILVKNAAPVEFGQPLFVIE